MPPNKQKNPQNSGRPKTCSKVGLQYGIRYNPQVIKKQPTTMQAWPKTIKAVRVPAQPR